MSGASAIAAAYLTDSAASWAEPLDLARLLGARAWARLPAALRRRFASDHTAISYRGSMDLDRSRLGALFAWCVKPLGGPLVPYRLVGVPTVVAVSPLGAGVVWERRFGWGSCVRSVKQLGPDGRLMERTHGGLSMSLDLTEENGALVFTSRRFFLSVGCWQLPIPVLLTPGTCRVTHEAIGERQFRFTLTMTHRLWGTTFRQSGIFEDPS